MRRILKSALLTTALVMTAGTAVAATTTQAGARGSASPSGTYQPELLMSPPALTPAQAAAREAWANRERGHGTLEANRRAAAGPTPGTEAQIGIAQELGMDGDAAGVEPAAPNTFSIYTNKVVKPYLGGLSSSVVSEPAHANSGKYVFYTGNWYAARSANKGGTWTYINPYADFADFCCDQDVIYDQGRDMLIWYRQGVQLGGGNNNFKLGVSLNGGISWTQYTITYTNYSGLPLGWFDYPHLAVTRNYLYITSNYFNTNGTFQRMILSKFSLDQLQAQGGLGWTWWNRTTGWTWTPAQTTQSASDVMYLGDHTNQSTFNVCDQPESNSTLTCRDVAVPAWTATGRGSAVCTVPNGFNPCFRLDQRITAGWVRGNEVGFFWTVAQGAGFPYPYVNSATFNRTTFAYTGRPYIWSGGAAWIYGGAAPNVRADLGIAAYYVGGGIYPYIYVGIDDDYNGAPPGWEVAFVRASTTSTSSNWGDYLRVRQHGPDGNGWSVSGHTTQTVATYGTVNEGTYATFGRGRDKDGYDRFRTK